MNILNEHKSRNANKKSQQFIRVTHKKHDQTPIQPHT